MREVQILDRFPVEGKRYDLQPGRSFKVKGRRGDFKVARLDLFPDGTVEALCWWKSGAKGLHVNAQWVTVGLTGPHAVEVARIAKVE